ncbi:uncharacterized protein LOC127733567 [Mytilus californianus]|uniref:uncharacterized protein LOC127733567 n=1 Tax=Mytilus californianus TaxID=6549 RepID=UPI002247CEE9|nr:uncharacterized protein LOC127733567 [Mytilus californianus]
MGKVTGWLLLLIGIVCIFSSTVTATFNVSHPCNRPLASTFSSNLTEEIKVNCTNGTMPWNVPMRYLETRFQPINIEEEHCLCIERISSTTIDIIENDDGELTWLPLPKPGKPSCSKPKFGNITMAFKGPHFPTSFAVFISFKLVKLSKQEKE